MRNLTKKQKNLLDIWYEKNKKDIEIGRAFFDLGKCDLFPYELLQELEQIHDTEILYQNINNYISDK